MEVRMWKGTELRTFMLYTGPVALKGVLSDDKYAHFIKFHLAMLILVSVQYNDHKWIDYAECLLRQFVQETCSLYSKDWMVYNFHSLLHLCDDVRIHGKLDRFSAFEFENHMAKLKKLLRANHSHLSQVVNRIAEQNEFDSFSSKDQNLVATSISSKTGNNVFLCRDGRICQFVSSVNSEQCLVQFFEKPMKAKLYPCDSRKFSICVVKSLEAKCVIAVREIVKMCFLLPFKNRYLIFPLCNSEKLDYKCE